ncbi:MAG: hypothetical protein IPM99_00555 [Rubrivivax sp.]|jgi:hypothetical protein|nr:hypothetical protein [Rubrivivax sp.]
MKTPQAHAPPPAPAPGAARRAALGGSFLSGAVGRLLPASVPFRYFGAAVVFHLAAWLVVLLSAADWPAWRGGLGWPLAALHLVTLGTLAASAIGASLQLLPVATRMPVRWPRLPALLWWIYVPGVVVLTAGMGLARPPWLALGAAGVIAVLLGYGLLLALNLRGARGMAGVVLHGWGALIALALLLASATALVMLWLGRPLLDRDSARGLHLAAGVFGFMGLLALGLSSVLLPMFALGRVPDDRRQLAAGGAALAAVALAAAAALAPAVAMPLRVTALLCGAVGLVLHLRLMRGVLAGAMRPDLGWGGRLMHMGWAGLALTLVLAAAALAADAASPWARLFGLAAVGGWLTSFLFGVLQRILPFLAAMHAAQGRRRAPTPSALTLGRALAWHAVAHALALVLLAAGIAASSALLVRAAGATGTVGAAAFAVFLATLLQRLRRAMAAPAD